MADLQSDAPPGGAHPDGLGRVSTGSGRENYELLNVVEPPPEYTVISASHVTPSQHPSVAETALDAGSREKKSVIVDMSLPSASTHGQPSRQEDARKGVDASSPAATAAVTSPHMSVIRGLLPVGFDKADDVDVAGSDATSDVTIGTDSIPDSSNFMGAAQRAVVVCTRDHKKAIGRAITAILLVGYSIYFGFSIAYSVHGAIALMVFTGLVFMFWSYGFVRDHWGKQIYRGLFIPIGDWLQLHWNVFRWFVYPAPPVGLILYLCWLIRDVRQLQSLSGFVAFFLVLWITSKHPNKVVWRPVLWGYALQFIMAILVLQWDKGYIAIDWLAEYITKIISFGYDGAAAVWTDPFMVLHPYVMMGMSLLIYVGALMSILYYYGLTQAVAGKLAWIMSRTMGTTAIETMGVASNIFLNGMDVIMMLRYYLDKLTMSEMNCFMVGNNATIAGFMFGLLILLGAPAQHLLTAAVMSSPAAIAIAKLNYPEIHPERSKTANVDDVRFMKGPEKSLFEAAANGSAVAGKTALMVIVNYISFMSLLAFLDATLSWLGGMVGHTEVSFEWICSYLFYPIAVLIGVEIQYCREIGKVIGLKIFTTEIYSYQVLGQLFDQGLIDERSKALGTYALCGFCSMSTLAIALGVWDVICPPRRPLVAKLMLRVMAEANIACYTTASIAGLFYSENITILGAEPNPASVLLKVILGRFPTLLD